MIQISNPIKSCETEASTFFFRQVQTTKIQSVEKILRPSLFSKINK